MGNYYVVGRLLRLIVLSAIINNYLVNSGELESQEHLEVCEGTERERRGLPGQDTEES